MSKKHFDLIKKERSTFQKSKKKSKKDLVLYLLIILIIVAGYFFIFNKIYGSTIYPRVYCDNFNLSGLKLEEAKTLLEVPIEKVNASGFSFLAKTALGEKHTTIEPRLIAPNDPDLSRFIVNFDIENTLKEAYAVGRRGNLLEKISARIFSFTRDKKIDLKIQINEQDIKQILKNNFSALETPAENAKLEFSKTGELVLTKEKPGFILDYQKAIIELSENLKNFKNEEIEIPTLITNPEVKSEECAAEFSKAQDLLASSPYTLQYNEKKWNLEKKQIGEWLIFTKNSDNTVELTLDDTKIDNFLAKKIGPEINIEPQDAKFKIENNKVIEFQSGQSGHLLNANKNIEIIKTGILGKNKNIELIVDETKPKISLENINDLGIEELIGRGVSNFAGSPKNRRYNIKIGSQKLHGILIPPNEEFSLVKAIGSVNKETGFLPELVIKGDRTIPEYGGGLCQIGTTTFRVALNAGLPITERTPHSYRVVYYEPAGMDATIYNPAPDLKFINDTGHYILFQTEIMGDELIFEFYGTSDGRKVETTKPKIFNVTQPGPVKFIETEELEPGQKKKIESAHPGADAEFKNIVTFPNGTIREEVWRSHYQPWPEVWLIGKAKTTAPEL